MAQMPAYRGDFLVPWRVIKAARQAVQKADLTHPQIPTAEELEALLQLLGFVVLGSRTLFDGTVPADFRGGAKDPAPNTAALDNHVEPMEHPPPSRSQLSDSTAMAASLLVRHINESIKSPVLVGERIDRDKHVEPFFKAAREIAASGDTKERSDLAWTAYEKGFMGGKLLLGLAAGEHDRILQTIAGTSESLRQAMLSTLSTKFRAFLLATWAPSHGALFAPLPEQIAVLEGFRRSLWRELLAGIESAPPPPSGLDVLPLIGA